jgi:hypothetical protein
MKRLSPEERYNFRIRKQEKTLEEFAEHEFEWAEDLMTWYGYKKQDMPDDEYRAYAFFRNREHRNKPGSLSLLYEMYLRCLKELPDVTRENAFDILCFRFKMYAAVLRSGGFS